MLFAVSFSSFFVDAKPLSEKPG